MDRQAGKAQEIDSSFSGRIAAFLSHGLLPLSVVLGLYFCLSLAIRLILPNSLTLDEAEQALFSQHWLAGYGPQPPFYNWVQNVFVSVLGVSLFSLALPKFLMLFLAYFFFGMAARELDAKPGFVAMATLSLLTLPQVSYMPQQDLTHTIAVLMATSLFLYGLLRTLTRPDWAGYAILGLAIGIGTISKYNFVLLPLAAAVAVALDREWRARLFDRRVVLTLVVSFLIVLPHALWLIGNLDMATSGTLGKMSEANAPHGLARILRALGSLGSACIAFCALTTVIFAIAFRKEMKGFRFAGDRWSALLGRIMLFSILGVVFVIFITGTTKITERWLNPYLLVFPLYLLIKLDRAGLDIAGGIRRFMPVFATIMVITLIPLAGKTMTAAWTGSYTRINYPFGDLAEAIAEEGRPASILARGMHLAGNMRMQFPDVPVIDVDHAPVSKAGLSPRPALAVWVADNPDTALPPGLEEAADSSQLRIKTLSRPYLYGDGSKTLTLAYVWLR